MNPTNEYKDKNIKVAVFDKTSKDGKPYKSISIQKSNKDKDGVWKNETMYLFENEAKAVINLLNEAINKTSTRLQQDKQDCLTDGYFPEDSIPFNDAVVSFAA